MILSVYTKPINLSFGSKNNSSPLFLSRGTLFLIAAQALHAGTIQERPTAQADSTEGHSDVPTAEVVSAYDEEETVQEQKGFFARIFGKKDRRK